MRRMKRWLAMSLAVLITAGTLAGDYMIATAAELPVTDEVVSEQKDDTEETAKVEVTAQPKVDEEKEQEAALAPTAEVVVDATAMPEIEVTPAPVTDDVSEAATEATPAPETEGAVDATTTPEAEKEAEVTPTPEAGKVEEATPLQEVEDDEAGIDETAITISYLVNDDKFGYIEGETEYFETTENDEEIIQGAVAVPNDGYVFVNWTDAEGDEVGTEEKFVPAEKVTAEYTANFTEETEEKEEAAEEVRYPAVDFGSYYVSDMQVTISAPEGAFPEGTVVAVREVSVNTAMDMVEDAVDESAVIAEVKAVDITFTDKDGNEIQPLVPISVLFSQANLEGNSFAVYHVDENEVEKVADLVSADGGAISADAFSMYVLVGTNSINIGEMATYTMYQGETIKVYADTTDTSGSFSVSGASYLISLSGKSVYDGKYPAVEVTATDYWTGEATITYTSGSYVQTIKIVVKQKRTVSFDANGGNVAAPSSINAVAGTEITMPSYTGTKNGYVFVGWCKRTDVNERQKYKAGDNYIIYPAGSKYIVTDAYNNNKFYAIWASTSGTDAEFYIRNNPTIPYEPQGHSSSDFSSAIKISNAIKIATFYTNQSGVESHLNTVPTDAQIKAVRPDYNPETDYILWYVIKRESTWHVDGVLLKKELVNLTYDPNAGEVTVFNMPVGEQYAVGAAATVSTQVPTRTGYTFDSWNTSPDGSGTRYTGSETFTINENTTLYAQWVPASNTKYVVQRYDADTNTLMDEFVRNAVTDSVVHATAADKVIAGYTFVEDHANNVTSGVVAADGSLVLKLYFNVKDITVTITENSGTYTYDGTEKSVAGYTVSISDPSYTEADFTFNGEAIAKGTNVGTYDMNVKASDFANTNSKFSKVTFVVVDGTLAIKPVDSEVIVTITENSGSYTYDGTEKSIEDYIVKSISNAKYTEADFTFSGEAIAKGTDVGTYPMEVKAEDFTNTNKNFTNVKFVIEDGQLEITPVTDEVVVTVTENSGSYTYDGTEKSVEGYTVTSISNNLYKETDFTFSGTAIAKGTKAGTYPMEVKPADFKNHNSNFAKVTFVVVDGSLTITPTEKEVVVVITEKSATYTYDGSEKAVTGYEVTSISNELYKETDFTFNGEAIAKGTNVGTYDMNVLATDFVNNNTDFSKVTFQIVDGTLTINPVADEVIVTVTENSASYVYDGSEKTVTGYTVTSISNSLYTEADFTFSGEAVAKGTDVGTYAMEVSTSDFENVNKNFSNVTFRVVDGELTITPVTEEVVVTVTENSASYTYDGNEKSVTGYEVTNITNSLYKETDFTFSGEAVARGTDAGTYDMNVLAADFVNNNKNFSNVTFVVADGQLVINPVTEKVVVTITENSASYTYDGSEKSVTGYEVTNISNALYAEADFTFGGEAVAKGTNVGTYDMEVVAGDFTNSNDNFSNVEFVIVNGQLEIIPIEEVVVTVREKSATYTYDGSEKSVTGYEVISITNSLYTENDFTFSGEAVVKGTKAGSYDMNVKAADFTNTNTNFAKVTFVVEDGQLIITPTAQEVIVYITENSGSFPYDGEEKTVTGYTVTGISNNLYKEADFSFSGEAVAKGTEVGEYDMNVKAEDFANHNPDFTNVTFVVVDGKLTITPMTDEVVVTITENSATYSYDGSEKSVKGYTVTSISNELYKETDFIFNGVAEAKGTEAGTYDMEVKAEDFTNNNKNFGKVTFKIVDGQLTITPVTEEVVVTVKENGATYTYDGTEKSVTGYTVEEISNTLYTEADFTFSGVAEAKGTEVGKYDMEVKPSDFTNTNHNFTNVIFKVVDDQLEITPVTEKVVVTVTENSGSYVYDGTKKSVTGYEVTSINNKLYTEADFIFNGTAVAEGTDVGTYDMGVEADKFVNTNSNFAVVEFIVVDGQLTITPVTDKVTVTITENSGSAVYDGSEKSVTGYEVTSISNDLYTEADFTFSGVAEAKGTNAGTYDMEVKTTDFVNTNQNFANVEFVIIDGQLIITPTDEEVVVMIQENSGSYVYDGSEKNVTGYEVISISNPNYTVADFTFGGEAIAKGSNVGSYDMNVKASDFANINGDFTKVTFVVTDGQLTITPVTDEVVVTVTENSGTAVYDGTEKTVTGYTVSDISNSLYTEADFSFQGEAIARGTNVGTYDMMVTADNFTNTNANFTNVTFVIVDGQLAITPAVEEVVVTITENSGSYVYDGSEKSVSGYEVTDISNALYTEADFTFDGNAVVKGTDAGTYDMAVAAGDFTNTNKNFTNVSFVIVDGQLTITPVTDEVVVTVTENSAAYTYDGSEKTVTGYEVTDISNTLYTEADFAFSGVAQAKGTNAGTYDMEVKAEDFTNINSNFANVRFVVVDGQLLINPVETEVIVTITENSGSAVYDGTEKSVTGYSVTSINNSLYTEANFTFSGVAQAKGVNAGSYDMEVKAEDFTNNNNNFAKVTFVIVDGQLVITPTEEEVVVIITENSATYTYDATEKTVEGYVVTSISSDLYTEADFSFTGTDVVKGSEVGSYDMELTADDFVNTNGDFANVTFVIVDGQLVITPISEEVIVTITENSGRYTFDGTEKTVEGYVVTDISHELYTEADFTFAGEAIVKGTNAGAYDMDVKVSDFTNTNDIFTNVTFVIVDGQLVIDPYAEEVKVQITGKFDTVLYDGQNHSVKGYDITINNETTPEAVQLVRLNSGVSGGFLKEEDIKLVGSDEVVQTNAGTYAQGLDTSDFTVDNDNFSNVVIEVTDGELVIEKRQVTLTSDSGRKVYDGTALTKKKVRVSGDGFAEGEGATYKVTGKQTQVGESKNKFGYTLNANTLADNYEISTVFGKLTVTPVEVTPTPEEPTPTPSNPTPTPTTDNIVIIEDEPVPMADAPVLDDGPAVLGARRTNDPGAAVLGARRGTEYAVLGKRRRPETGDSVALILWYIALGMSVGAAITAATKVRKTKVD